MALYTSIAAWPGASRAGDPAVAEGPPVLHADIDRRLSFPWAPGAPVFPTGKLLWATSPEGFGFPGDVHVVHHDRLKAYTLVVRWNGRDLEPGSGTGFASRVERVATGGGLTVTEAKLITPDDALVSVVRFQAAVAGILELRAESPLAREPGAAGDLTGSGSWHGIPLALAFRGPEPARGPVLSWARRLGRGQGGEVAFALAFARTAAGAEAVARRVVADPDPAGTQARATELWFDREAPQLDCPDPWFERAFLYRLQLAKKSLAEPGSGYLRWPVAMEGRWASTWYAAAIPFGAGHQLAELRWLADSRLAWGHLRNFVANQRADGAFVGARTDALLGEYTDFLGRGALDVYLATGEAAPLGAAASALARNVTYALTRDADRDYLPEPRDHWQSGMEFQPSFFAFSGYDPSRETQLERVEYACFLHANALAAARALEIAGRSGKAMREVADRVARAVEARLWDEGSRFYLALRATDHARSPDREVAGFYPPAFGISAPARLGYLAAIEDPERWASPFPVPSVEMASPAFHPRRGWPDGKTTSNSMWNGPVWPHAQSFVAAALAAGERAGALCPGTTFRFLERYTHAQFRGSDQRRDLSQPVTGEAYDPIRASWLTNERDYFHSTYVDLVVTLLAGLEPAEGDLVAIDPLLPAGTWDRFALTDIPYHGHRLAVVWDEPDRADAYGDGREGLTVWVDDRLAAERATLGPLQVPLKAAARP